MKPRFYILPTIVLSQFLCTSLWFAGNAIVKDLQIEFGLAETALGYLTSTVQFGFIVGTLLFALLSIADRFAPSRVFFFCALLGAACTIAVIWKGNFFGSIVVLRFLTGFFLAGIYPVGMKIAADYYKKGLGKSLGYLVGALVIGTALPHLLQESKGSLPWQFVLVATSVLAVVGGFLMFLLVPEGPFRKSAQKIDLSAIAKIFKVPQFRTAAFGYFGHMWELYAFWAFVPFLLQSFKIARPETSFPVALVTFIIIGSGGLACVISGHLAAKIGTKLVAVVALFLSCLCCLVSPLVFLFASSSLFILFLVFWGMVVIADSPLFSTLVAQNAPATLKGTALTIVNSIGFFLTILSILLLTVLQSVVSPVYLLLVLAIGPALGLIALLRNTEKA